MVEEKPGQAPVKTEKQKAKEAQKAAEKAAKLEKLRLKQQKQEEQKKAKDAAGLFYKFSNRCFARGVQLHPFQKYPTFTHLSTYLSVVL